MALVNEKTQVVSNASVGPNLYILKVASPEISSALKPGQFVHMKVPNMEGHILRRPFSVFACDKDAGTMDILYQVVGFGTSQMTEICAGDTVEMIGAIGRPWQPASNTRRALLVGGGVGAAPLYMLAEELVQSGVSVHVVLGAGSADTLVCRGRYEGLSCAALECATDDGTYGRAGFCTSLVEDAIADAQSNGEPFDYAAICGPEPLMRIASKMVLDANIPCEVSMEKRMACGIGACLSCVVETVDGKKRACVDGPIFNACEVVW